MSLLRVLSDLCWTRGEGLKGTVELNCHLVFHELYLVSCMFVQLLAFASLSEDASNEAEAVWDVWSDLKRHLLRVLTFIFWGNYLLLLLDFMRGRKTCSYGWS